MSKTILKLDNLSIGYKNKLIFKNINAQVSSSSITAVMGVNGTGKSCLLKTISNLIPIFGGEILLLDKKKAEYSFLDLAKIVSLVLTEKIHVDYLKVNELIRLGRTPYTNWVGQLTENDLKRVDQVKDQLGISQLGDCYFSDLSDGQKQKILIARALAQDPKILILDEPTTYLDIPSKIELLKLLKKIAIENQMAIVMSTHDLDLVEKECDQIWLMGKDESFFCGSPEVCRSTGLFKKHFLID